MSLDWVDEGDNCHHQRTIEHEFLHGMGFLHEQSRPDREKHIKIHFDRIKDDWHDQFREMKYWHNMSSPYDKRSVMHYSWDSFQTSDAYDEDLPVMTDLITGERVQYPLQTRMSSQDVFQLAAMYSDFCPAMTRRTCDNGDEYLANFAW